MKTLKKIIVAVLITPIVGLTAIIAQPSDAEIIKQLSGSGVSKVELSKSTTKKVWNSAFSQYMWSRGATVWRNANIPEYPNAKVVVYGYARYHYGASTSFREFKVAENTYEGIPAPNKQEIEGMLRARYKAYLGWRYNDMIGDLHYLRFAEEEGVIWHTPNSFTAITEVEYDAKSSYTEVTTYEEKIEVRFYRDDVNAEWQDKIAAIGRDKKALTVKKYSQDELDAMPTLSDTYNEQQAQAAMGALPEIEIPAFNRDIDVFLHTHRMLRNASREEMHAYLMKMLSPSYFVEGSSTQLNQNGNDLVNKVLDAAYNPKSNYAQQYCADPGVKHQQNGMIELWNKTTDKKTRMTVGLFGGGWKNGQKTGEEYKLTALEVWLWTDADNIARLNSYEPGFLCKSSAGSTSPSKTNTSVTNTESQKQEKKKGSLLNKSKGFLNKVTQP